MDNKEKNRLKQQRWRERHREENLNKVKQWIKDNPVEYRAMYLIQNYKRDDKLHNRGECTLTADWIIDNIFTSKCRYCEETDWRELGCDRIDNDSPHTPDNVIPCCKECNRKRGNMSYEEFIKK